MGNSSLHCLMARKQSHCKLMHALRQPPTIRNHQLLTNILHNENLNQKLVCQKRYGTSRFYF
jgi:hypothetical protein